LAIAITPGGRFGLVTLQGTSASPGHQLREINLATRSVSSPVEVGLNPESLAISPDGTTAYVAAFSSAEVTPVDLTTWPPQAETPIPLPGTSPRAIAISPNGAKAYVLDTANSAVVPINLSTRTVGAPVSLKCQAQGDPGCTPSSIVISGNGRTAYVAAAGSADVVLLELPSLTVAGVLQTGSYPDAVALSGRSLYVGNGASNTMSIFSGLAAPRTVGGVTYPFGIAVGPGASQFTDPQVSLPPKLAATNPSQVGPTSTLPSEVSSYGSAPYYGNPAP
jgi:DNA-binding beta-propeller fold protein YncE